MEIRIFVGIIIFLLSFCSGGSPDNIQLGCAFNRSAYMSSALQYQSERLIPSPEWGNEVEPLMVSNEDELKDLIHSLTDIHKEVLEKFKINTIDNFIRFYEDFKKYRLDFETFYARYIPAFGPRENHIGLAIEVLDQASDRLTRWPDLAAHAFLAACRYNSSSSWDLDKIWRTMASTSSSECQDNVHVLMETGLGHVLATIRYQVQGGREGYILMDQGYFWDQPLVLSLNGEQNNVIEYEAKKELQFVLNNAYAQWNHGSSHASHLIYLRRPFCSFLTITEKLNLVRPVHYLQRRDQLGALVADFHFRMKVTKRDKVRNVAMLRFQFDPHGFHGDSVENSIAHLIEMFEDAMQKPDWKHIDERTATHKDRDREVIAVVDDKLELGPGQLLALMKKVKSILKDKEFVRGCWKVKAELARMNHWGVAGVREFAKKVVGKLTDIIHCP